MSSKPKRKILVCGLKYHTTDETLRNYFLKYGKLSRCGIERNAVGESKGFAYVVYEESSSIDDCVRISPHTLDGNDLTIKVFRIKEKKKESVSSTNDSPTPLAAHPQSYVSDTQATDKKIFIGGLREGIDENNLRDHFSQFGKINQVSIMKHRDGKPRGFGFINFDDNCALTAVLEKQHTIKGRTLCVRKAIPKEKMIHQQQDFENDQYHSTNQNYENIPQSSSRHIGPIRRGRNHDHTAVSRNNNNRYTPYDKRIRTAGDNYPKQINIYLN